MIATFVESPLCWAISSGINSPYHDVESLKGAPWAVSRLTSGSHLMAIVLAHQRGWDLEALRFEPLGNFEALRRGVNEGRAAAFMWETFTTKPYHDAADEIKRIGEITTPWSCFMIAGTKQALAAHSSSINSALLAVREACDIFHTDISTMPSIIAAKYGLKQSDAEAWYSQVKLSASPSILQSGLSRALTSLKDAKVLEQSNTARPEDLLDLSFAKLETKDIKAMKLYARPELIKRTYNELNARGWASGDLDWRQLGEIDQQHHYHGIDAVEAAIAACHISASSNVINLGSGLGGPARYIAGKTGASVLALELQADLSQVAEELTIRTNLSSLVHHIAANFLTVANHLRLNSYNAIVSWLTVLHIADRSALFSACHNLLSENGVFYAEDFFRLGTFTTEELATLQQDVYCSSLPTESEYRASLTQAGFEVLKFEDLTADWTLYAATRVASMESNRESFVKLHGIDIYQGMHYFYSKVKDLFAGGNLGGVRVVARKI